MRDSTYSHGVCRTSKRRKSIVKKDQKSVDDYGEILYTHPTSELVQSAAHAEYIATVLLDKMKAGEGVITQPRPYRQP